MPSVQELLSRGEIGGRTVQIVETGKVECHVYPTAPLGEGRVRVRTIRSAISPGTEMTFIGRDASNVYLHKHWNEELRLFEAGPPSMSYPITFGYRAAGEVIESRSPDVPVGSRVFGSWRHTELTSLTVERALAQGLPDELSWDDAVDVAQMGPICVNAVAFAEREHHGAPVVVFGAGPVGLLTAQVARADGADRVYVVDRIPHRLQIAQSLGLEPLQADDHTDIAAALKRRHGSEGIPVAIECTGSTFALYEAIRVVRRQGRVIAVGFYQGDNAQGLRLGDEFHHNGVRVVSGQIGNLHPSFDMAALRRRTMELRHSGQLVLGDLPRLTVPVQDVASGIEALKRPAEVLQVALSYDV